MKPTKEQTAEILRLVNSNDSEAFNHIVRDMANSNLMDDTQVMIVMLLTKYNCKLVTTSGYCNCAVAHTDWTF